MNLVARVAESPLFRFPRVLPIAIAAGALLGSLGAVFGLFMDDYLQQAALAGEYPLMPANDLFRFTPADPAQLRESVVRGPFPWWTSADVRLAFWRPLSSALAMLDHALFGRFVALAHVHSALWYAALVGAVGLLFRRVLPAGAAALALVLYALCDSHVLPAIWLPNRNAIVANAPVVLGLWAHVRHREEGWQAGRFLAPLLFALGLSGGEAAFGGLAYVFAYEAFGARDGVASRVRALAPATVVVASYLALYKHLGYGAAGSDMYVDPIATPLKYLSIAPGRLLTLVAGLVLKAPSDLWAVESLRPALFVAGTIATALLVAYVRWLWPRIAPEERAASRWLLAGALGSSLPVLATFPSTRLLLMPSLGVVAVLAIGVRQAWLERAGAAPTPRPLRWAAGYVVVVHLALAPFSWLLLTGGLTFATRHYEELFLAIDADDTRWPEQEVILPLAPDPPSFIYPPFVRWFHGHPRPRAWRVLSAAQRDHRLTRTGPQAIELEVLGGSLFHEPFELLFHATEDRMEVGRSIAAGSFTATILAADEVGPTRIAFAFDRPLEDPSLSWIAWQRGGLRTLALPQVGGTVLLTREGVLGQ